MFLLGDFMKLIGIYSRDSLLRIEVRFLRMFGCNLVKSQS